VQKKGGKAAFIDAENAIDPRYAKALGVNIEELVLSQPDSGEQALEITELLIKSNAIDLIVIDSVAALVPQAELDGEMSDAHVGLQARLMSKAMRKLAGVMNRSECTVIFINQMREKIGIMFGNPETTSGGKALKFYASIRLDIRKGEAIKNGTEVIGNKVTVKVVKNKVAPPFKIASIEIMFGEGISRLGELVELAVQYEIIQKSGSWMSYKTEKIGQGKEAVKAYLQANPIIANSILEALKPLLFMNSKIDGVE
jgi:recombination protein RecA